MKKYPTGKTSGFTLAETMLAVAVIAVLVTVAFPDIVNFLELNEQRQEQEDMREIKKALTAFSLDNRSLPNQNTWFDDLAEYSILTAEQMRFDTWENERQYRIFTRPDVFRTVAIPIDYVVIYSVGQDGLIDGDVMASDLLGGLEPGNATDPLEDFPTATQTDLDNSLDDFRDINIGNGDDGLIKVSTWQTHVDDITTTFDRMDAIIGALDTYASQRMAEAEANGEANRDEKNFFPPSAAPEGVPDVAVYGVNVLVDAAAFFGTTGNVVDNGLVVTTRRDSMIQLMRLIGLPDSYCCNEHENGAIPFFYFSNPRQIVNNSTCGARQAGPVAGQPYYPPKIAIEFIANGTTGATCG